MILSRLFRRKDKKPIDWAKLPRLNLTYDNQYEFSSLANMSPFELVYVASEEDEQLNEMFVNHMGYFSQWAEQLKMKVVYLPTLYQKLMSEDVLRYRDPSKTVMPDTSLSVGNDYLLKYLIHPEDREKMKSGFLWTNRQIRKGYDIDTYIFYFFPLTTKSPKPIEQQLEDIRENIAKHASWLHSDVRYMKAMEPELKGERNFADANFRPQNSRFGRESTDDLLEEIRARVNELRQRDVAEHILEELIHPQDEPSKMLITKDYSIVLQDFDNMEIKMEPLAKAVYLLFLNHPKGIRFKDLPDYRKELTNIYLKLKPNGLTEKAVKSIEDVTNPTLNSINEKCARIRGAFVREFDNHIARHYYIDGLRGEKKKITLPRNLVIWE